MAVQIARSSLHPGDYTYIWSPQGGLQPYFSLDNQSIGNFAITRVPLATRSYEMWDPEYHVGLVIPDPIPGGVQGTFQLWHGPDPSQATHTKIVPDVNVRLIPRDDPSTSMTILSPGTPEDDDAPAIQLALQTHRLVVLRPGVYNLRSRIDFPSYYSEGAPGVIDSIHFRTLRGYGAILVRRWEVGPRIVCHANFSVP